MWDAERESGRWLEQAARDVGAGWALVDAGYFEHACFMAQQGAEKAMKAIAYALGERKVLGHSVRELTQQYSVRVPSLGGLLPSARILDLYYVPTRYPNGLPGGVGRDAFTKKQAMEGLAASERFLDVAREIRARWTTSGS